MNQLLKDTLISLTIVVLLIVILSVGFAPDPTKPNELKMNGADLPDVAIIKQTVENESNMITEEYMHKMKLHDQVNLNTNNGNILIIRVPSGWIYSNYDIKVFVPEIKKE